MLACDDLITCSDKCIYVNTALGHASCIDHCFLTPSLRRVVNKVSILNSGANHSDHRHLCVSLDFNWIHNSSKVNCDTRKPMYKILWGKGSLSDYYSLTGEALQALNFGCTCLKCELGCSSSEHANYIDVYYSNIVTELKWAEQISISSIPHSAQKHFWNDELDELKQKSIMWHDIWKNSDRPGSGIIPKIKCSCKLKYKSAKKMPSVTTKMNIAIIYITSFILNKWYNKARSEVFRNIGT